MNIEDVDKTMDEISDAQDQMQQMNDVLAQPIGGAADLDDDELAAELAVRLLHSNMHVQCAVNLEKVCRLSLLALSAYQIDSIACSWCEAIFLDLQRILWAC